MGRVSTYWVVGVRLNAQISSLKEEKREEKDKLYLKKNLWELSKRKEFIP